MKITAQMEGAYAANLAKRLQAAELSGNVDDMVAVENDILALIDFDLDDTEQGLTSKAAQAIEAFCDEHTDRAAESDVTIYGAGSQ